MGTEHFFQQRNHLWDDCTYTVGLAHSQLMSVAIQSVLISMYLCGRRGNTDTQSGGRGLHHVIEDYYERQNGNLVALV